MSQNINLLLKETVNRIIEKYSNFTGIKSKVARILMGTNNQPAFLKWINDNDNTINFGIKPLSRIGESLGYKVIVTFVEKDDNKMTQLSEEYNLKFINHLESAVNNYLENIETNTKSIKTTDKIVSEYEDLFSSIDNK